MKFKSLILSIRILVAIGVPIGIVRYLYASSAGGEMSAETKLTGLFLFMAYGGVLFLLFGIPWLRRAGDQAASFYLPSDENFRDLPEYSLAEARLKLGDYDGAIAQYRDVIIKFPGDVFAHVQIARIAADHLNDQRLAEAELLTATAKAVSEDALVLAYNRLADHYQLRLKNTSRAIDVIKQLREKVGPAAAERTKERLLALHLASQKAAADDDAPANIAFRTANEETLKKRRGF